ncbi:hypothetical protein B0O99DRAFT_288722 [Bisporella sp. PMI_857]|nr:hypothetical protein B0O99DRAFT_288722 [Bisporella sp. PMI_857]
MRCIRKLRSMRNLDYLPGCKNNVTLHLSSLSIPIHDCVVVSLFECLDCIHGRAERLSYESKIRDILKENCRGSHCPVLFLRVISAGSLGLCGRFCLLAQITRTCNCRCHPALKQVTGLNCGRMQDTLPGQVNSLTWRALVSATARVWPKSTRLGQHGTCKIAEGKKVIKAGAQTGIVLTVHLTYPLDASLEVFEKSARQVTPLSTAGETILTCTNWVYHFAAIG